MLTEKKIWKLYNTYKELARKYLNNKNYSLAMEAAYYASSIMFKYQIVLVDEEIENILQSIGKNLIDSTREDITDIQKKQKLLFYDSIGRDNIALGYQYVSGLIGCGFDFLCVIKGEKKDNERIIKLIEKYDKAQIVFISDNSYVEGVCRLDELIRSYEPSIAIIQMANVDVIGDAVWSNQHGIKKFYINHGDEQFWLGKNCLDYCVCFRNRGAYIACKDRGISENKIHILPFFPIIEDEEFNGFDFEIPKGSIILFSGGRFSKIYGDKCEFANMIIAILQQNPEAYFIFAGSGDPEPLKKILSTHKVIDRVRVIPYRKDLLGLMKNIDIYLSSYPVIGGLMTQYAAYAEKPIVELYSGLGDKSLDVLPNLENDSKLTFYDIDHYLEQVNKLIIDPSLRNAEGKKNKNGLVSEETFVKNLNLILNESKNTYVYCDGIISDSTLRSQKIIEADNEFMHVFPTFYLSKSLLLNKPGIVLFGFGQYIKHHGIKRVIGKVSSRFRRAIEKR